MARPGFPPQSGQVSLQKLAHKPLKAARKAFSAAERSFKQNNLEDSIGHLRKAVEIDPSFAEAWTCLGVRLIAAGSPEQAIHPLNTATTLDPGHAFAHLGLSFAYLRLLRGEEAEAPARRALQLRSGWNRAHYALGLALAQQGKVQAARPHLLRAVDEVPVAKRALAEVERVIFERSSP